MNRPKTPRKPTALVIDRDADVHRFVHVCLGKQFDVHHAYFPALAISLLKRGRFTVVVASSEMEDGSESSGLREAIRAFADTRGAPVIRLLPGPRGGQRRKERSDHVVDKPLNAKSFSESLNRALREEVAIPAFVH